MKNASRAISNEKCVACNKIVALLRENDFGRVQNDSAGSEERVVVTKLGTEANNIIKKQLSKFESIRKQKSVPSSSSSSP